MSRWLRGSYAIPVLEDEDEDGAGASASATGGALVNGSGSPAGLDTEDEFE